ncbi:hypothetical protein BDZ89DRAFT_965831, partial [Hymenopellis radicata]
IVPPPKAPCPGSPLNWDIPHFYVSYPFAIHDPGVKNPPGYFLHHVGSDPSAITVISNRCKGIATSDGGPCSPCSTASVLVDVVKDKASRSLGAFSERSQSALIDQIAVLEEANKKLRFQNIDYKRDLTVSRARVIEHSQFLDLVSRHDVPGLHRLIATALKEKVAIGGLLKRVQKAIDGKWHARNYSQADYDLAMLIYELGGGGAVYALNHAGPREFSGSPNVLACSRVAG